MAAIENKLVFIVEDNEMYSTMLDYTLSNDSIVKFMCFKTGEECLEHMHLKPMMIILDFWLPGMNGLETFKKIRSNNPTIAVAILTQDHDIDIARKLLNAGVTYYFNKGEGSVFEIKQLINNELSKVIKKQEVQTSRMRAMVLLFWIVAISIVIIYVKRY